jgi:hypothetical protein
MRPPQGENSILHKPYSMACGPASAVGIATSYWLDGTGIEYRWRRDFQYLSRPALGLTQPPVQWGPSLSPEQRAAGAGR